MIEPQPDAGDSNRPLPLRRFTHEAMACTFEVLLAEAEAEYAEQAARATFAGVDRLEQELSRFVPHSDVARINVLKPGQTARVGIEVIECLQLSAQLYEQTGGAFDITFATRATRPPDEPQLEFDPRSHSVGVRAEGVQVDLGGIGKGYAVDQMVAILREWSISTAMVHCGQSTVFTLGRPADAEGWSVAIRNPVKHDEELGRVQLTNAALSGSGRELHGEHIIDPRTSRAVSDKHGAWALAPSAALSDALSTAFMVMSPDEVAEYCRRHADTSALLVVAGGERPEMLSLGSGLAPFRQ
jgi:thiamine biosynthesis lipoprotein